MASERQKRANRWNWQLWRGVSPEGRESQRRACRRNRPWVHSTGPRTAAGKLRSRENALFLGEHCETVEPYAALRRFEAATNRLRDVGRRCIVASLDPLVELSELPEALEAEKAVGKAFQRLCDATGVYPTDTEMSILDALSTMMSDAHAQRKRCGDCLLAIIFGMALVYANDAVWWIRYARMQRITSLRGLVLSSGPE